jgi:predicted dehydrogenase
MKIAIIGYGDRISSFLDTVFKCSDELRQKIKIVAITEIDIDKTKRFLKKKAIKTENISFYTDANEMLEKENMDGVLIGTRCSLHAKMALKVLEKNIALFLEKPVATNIKDLITLKNKAAKSKSEVVVSFPLRVTPIVKLVKEIVESGKIGKVEHLQAINNVPYGGVYYHNWYRDENETGGLFLQKATHDLDYINYLLDLKPVIISAMKSKQIFKGDKPAGLLCKNCDEYETCPESPFVLKYIKNETVWGDMCCFAKDTGNQDSGSILVKYEKGMHVSYSQNFFARKYAAARGARLLGYKGTIEFDFYKDEVKVFMHDTSRVETYKTEFAEIFHWGGDEELAYNFIKVMQGEEKSIAPIDAGLISALMCLKAKISADTNTFQSISWDNC